MTRLQTLPCSVLKLRSMVAALSNQALCHEPRSTAHEPRSHEPRSTASWRHARDLFAWFTEFKPFIRKVLKTTVITIPVRESITDVRGCKGSRPMNVPNKDQPRIDIEFIHDRRPYGCVSTINRRKSSKHALRSQAWSRVWDSRLTQTRSDCVSCRLSLAWMRVHSWGAACLCHGRNYIL